MKALWNERFKLHLFKFLTLNALLNTKEIMKIIAEGSQTQNNSLLKTSHPLRVKNPDTLIGETSIGLNEKKYRSLIKGENNATPSPPSVQASNNG